MIVTPAPQPTCTLTPPSQAITAGQSATLSFGSTHTVSISNLGNISAGIISPNLFGSFNVTPTGTTIYTFTANGVIGTTPAICTGIVTVNAAPLPTLQIQKTLLVNQAYHSGDLVGWRIDFKNI